MNHIRPDAEENPYAEEEAFQETSSIIKALESLPPDQLERAMALDADGYDTRERRYKRCRSCGQGGYTGAYPFSTIPDGNECDDCI